MDKIFFKLYNDTCEKAKELINSKESTPIIMPG